MLFDCSALNEAFNIEGSSVIEIDIDPSEKCGYVPSNDIGGEDQFWNVATDDMIAKRNKAISDGWQAKSEEYMVKHQTEKLEKHPQAHRIVLDGIEFPSKNAAARYAMKEYGVSRNTALRYMAEGRDMTDLKYSHRHNYKGTYTATKYL